ncbi:MAG: phospholipid scramblase 1 [Sclerophora amabilis]|nr:MAG: phospholipid scramblase 1 [Sclerophora amabilis]
MDKILLSFLIAELLFLGTAGGLIGIVVTTKNEMAQTPTPDSAARDLLLMSSPVTGALINGVLVIVAFFLGLPALFFSATRSWMTVHGWSVVICAIFTLVLGLDVWYHTLQTRSNLSVMWGEESPRMQSLLQQRFDCCGYLDPATPPFQKDATCPNALAAAQKIGCVGAFSNFANGYLNVIFTACFGVVALDVILLLCIAMMMKGRKEKERYRNIDQKNGFGGI